MFENIKPLFAKKPLIVCVNKVDVKRLADLSEERQRLFDAFREEGVTVLEMSTMTEEGVMKVKSEVRFVFKNFFRCKPKFSEENRTLPHLAAETKFDVLFSGL